MSNNSPQLFLLKVLWDNPFPATRMPESEQENHKWLVLFAVLALRGNKRVTFTLTNV